MELRVARHTERLDAVVAFYRDGLGLPEIGGFRDHDGYDGVFLSIPGTGAHLELTAGGDHGAALPHPESLLVLYLGDQGAVEAVIARLDAEPLAPANPYWADHGVMVEDPDGFRVVLVPESWAAPRAGVEIAWHDRPRSELRHLFELAEDSRERIDASIDEGRVLVAMDGATAVGYLQLIGSDAPVKPSSRAWLSWSVCSITASGVRSWLALSKSAAPTAYARFGWERRRRTLATCASTNGSDSGCSRSKATPSPWPAATPRRWSSRGSRCAIAYGWSWSCDYEHLAGDRPD